MSLSIALGIGTILAIIATVAIMILVYPKSKDGKLNKYLQKIHDIVHFKTLIIESILKFFYIFATCSSIFNGFFMLFSKTSSYYYSHSYFVEGLCLLFLGPLFIRICYEFTLMMVLAVQNIIEINKKLPKFSPNGEILEEEKVVVEPKMLFCTQCGTRYDANAGDCPKCDMK